jgi:DNA-directed RNA polymerase
MGNLILKDNAMSEQMADVIVKFVKDKETKNTIRFTASGDISGSIYVKKDCELAKESEIVLEIPHVGA